MFDLTLYPLYSMTFCVISHDLTLFTLLLRYDSFLILKTDLDVQLVSILLAQLALCLMLGQIVSVYTFYIMCLLAINIVRLTMRS